MSILSSLLRDVAALFFPPRCPVCGQMLAQGEHTVCTLCRATAPLTGFWRQADNPVLGRCRDMLPVERASGLLYYVHGSGWRELIRGFKYRGAWRTARAMGEWYGRCLKESGLYDDVEVVVPLPLHPVKRCRRGYNQSEYIAEGIAAQLGVEVDRRSVRRKRNTESQALKRAETGPAMSRMRSPSSVPGGLRGGTSCWWTTCSPRAARCFRAPGRFCARRPVAASASPRSPSRGTLWVRRGRVRKLFFNGPSVPAGAGAGPKLCYKHSFRQNIPRRGFEFSRLIATFGL